MILSFLFVAESAIMWYNDDASAAVVGVVGASALMVLVASSRLFLIEGFSFLLSLVRPSSMSIV